MKIQNQKQKKHRIAHSFAACESTSPMSIARKGIFSGHFGTIEIILPNNQGMVSFECSGQNQAQADIIDYFFAHHIESFIGGDGSLYLGSVLTDFFVWKGNKTSDARTFRNDAEELQNVKIRVKTAHIDGSSPIVIYVGYIDRARNKENYIKALPVKKGRVILEDSIEINKKQKSSLKPGEMFYIQIAPLYLRFIEQDTSLKYPELVPKILALKSDALKRCVRYFLTHTHKDGWTITANKKEGMDATRVLCCHLWLDHMEKDKHTRTRRERALKANAELLKEFGILFDAKNDRWTYKRHLKVTYRVPETAKKVKNEKAYKPA